MLFGVFRTEALTVFINRNIELQDTMRTDVQCMVSKIILNLKMIELETPLTLGHVLQLRLDFQASFSAPF